MVKVLGLISRILFILCLPLLFLSASIALTVNSAWFYGYGFEKYNVSQITGIDRPELHKAADGLISYFNSEEEYINLVITRQGKPFTLFNEREVQHLKDVKELFRLDYQVLFITSIYAFMFSWLGLFWLKGTLRRQLGLSALWGGIITLSLMLILGIAVLFDFDRLFWQFHLLSFANDFWLLDPSKDYLIMLFPQGFWFDVTIFCAMLTIVMALIVTGLSGWHVWRTRKNKTSHPVEAI